MEENENENENEEVEVEVEKKVVKKENIYSVEEVTTQSEEQIVDSEGKAISDRELLVRIYNDVLKLKKGIIGKL